MELSKEAQIWFEQQEILRKSIWLDIGAKNRDIEGYKRQIELIEKSIDLSVEMVQNIDATVNRVKKEWSDGKVRPV